jgi:hypothetical protein
VILAKPVPKHCFLEVSPVSGDHKPADDGAADQQPTGQQPAEIGREPTDGDPPLAARPSSPPSRPRRTAAPTA